MRPPAVHRLITHSQRANVIVFSMKFRESRFRTPTVAEKNLHWTKSEWDQVKWQWIHLNMKFDFYSTLRNVLKTVYHLSHVVFCLWNVRNEASSTVYFRCSSSVEPCIQNVSPTPIVSVFLPFASFIWHFCVHQSASIDDATNKRTSRLDARFLLLSPVKTAQNDLHSSVITCNIE